MGKDKCKMCAFYRGIIKDLLVILSSLVSEDPEKLSGAEMLKAMENVVLKMAQYGPTMQ
jgi:hypothetical protein